MTNFSEVIDAVIGCDRFRADLADMGVSRPAAINEAATAQAACKLTTESQRTPSGASTTKAQRDTKKKGR